MNFNAFLMDFDVFLMHFYAFLMYFRCFFIVFSFFSRQVQRRLCAGHGRRWLRGDRLGPPLRNPGADAQ
jgi:hypothetical protein